MIADHFGAEVVNLPLATDHYFTWTPAFAPLPGGEILYYPAALDQEGPAQPARTVWPPSS